MYYVWLLLIPFFSYIQRKFIEQNTDIIIARYQENIEYLNNKKFANFKKIYIYNKGSLLDPAKLPKNALIINLPNVGCEVHTYLYHMIYYRNELANFNIFLPASYAYRSDKNKAASAMLSNYHRMENFFLGLKYENPINTELKDFSINEYRLTNSINLESINYAVDLLPCKERPFGVWFEKNFPNNQTKIATFCGIFYVKKEKILQNELAVYQKLINYVDNSSRLEAVHFMERSWHALLG